MNCFSKPMNIVGKRIHILGLSQKSGKEDM